MTQRERILAILVGGLAVLGVGQWGFSKYQGAIETRRNRYQQLQDRLVQLNEKRNLGALADRQMGEYLVRSVSSDTERARSNYQSWLFEIVKEHDIRGAKISGAGDNPVGGLYTQLSFSLTGHAPMPNVLGLIHEIQSKDYLHRIKELDLKPSREQEGHLAVTLRIDVASLNDAPVDAVPPESQAWRVDPDLTAYTEPILNRNPFQPPNQAPVFGGENTLEATVGREETFALAFNDPDQHALAYELVEAPENVGIDPRSGTLRVSGDELTEFDVTVQVTDDGYPRRTTKETLLVKVVEPPPPDEDAPAEEMQYDDAKQTYLTGLVQGSNDWTAWMNVRTRGETLKLRVGDEFEIGSVRGTVHSIDADKVQLKIDDKLVTLASGGALKSAVDAAE